MYNIKMSYIKRRIFYQGYKIKKYKYKRSNNIKNNILIPKIFAVGVKKNIQKIYRASLNQMHLAQQQKEITLSKQDTKIFIKKYLSKITEPKIFRPYLPNKVWKKMPWIKKQKHLNKRKTFIKNKIKFVRPKNYLRGKQYKAYFVSKEKRQFIKLLHPTARAYYLLTIIRSALCGAKKSKRTEFAHPIKKNNYDILNLKNFSCGANNKNILK